MNPRPVIGLEIHVQLATRTRLFCSCARARDTATAANHLTDPVSLGLPGTLPTLNRAAVELGLRLAVALDAEIASQSRFVRKHYFYPDLPRNFQITQEEFPLARGGRLRFDLDGRVDSVRIARAHLEEDAGRTAHRDGRTLVDFNRAGTGLLEIVTEPEMHDPREAAAAIAALRELARWLEVSEGELEEGHLRCDANVSLADPSTGEPGARVELKNLNSVRGVARALESEIDRQRELIEAGRVVTRQTRGWDEDRGESFALRTKEDVVDYCFLDEPDLGRLVIEPSMLQAVRDGVGELPQDVRARWVSSGMDPGAARILCTGRRRAAWCDAVLRSGAPADTLGVWASGELLRRAREQGVATEDLPWSPGALATLLAENRSGLRSTAEARQLLDEARDGDLESALLASPAGRSDPVDENDLRALLARYPEQVAHYRAGKLGLLGWFVAEFRRGNPDHSDPAAVAEILRRLLTRDDS